MNRNMMAEEVERVKNNGYEKILLKDDGEKTKGKIQYSAMLLKGKNFMRRTPYPTEIK